jgi:TRAP-type C4-dicarboxylate transport system permease small subunit
MLHVVADVMSKWLFNFPLVGTLEIVSNYYMVALIFLPLAYVQRAGGHIIVEIFTQSLARRAILVFDAAIGLFMFAYSALFVWRTTVEAIHKTAELEYLQATGLLITIWPVRWFLPLGFAVMGLIALRHVGASIRRLPQGDERQGG